MNHHLAGAGRVTIYFDRVRLTIEPLPASRILTVTVLVSSIDPSVNKSRAYIADLRHVPGAFDPAAAIPEALARDGLRIFGGGASWRFLPARGGLRGDVAGRRRRGRYRGRAPG